MQTLLSGFQQVLDRFGYRHRASFQLSRKLPLLLGQLREQNLFLGSATKIFDQTDSIQKPNAPLGGIPLPRFDPVAVIVLELVVIIMVTLTEGEESHDCAI